MRKKDEMEKKIADKSVNISWFVTVMTLFIIGFIEQIKTGERNIFLVIAIVSVLTTLFLERFILAKINEDNSFIKFILLVIVLTALMLLIAWLSISW